MPTELTALWPWLLGLGGAATALALGWLRSARSALYSYAFDRFATTVRIENNDVLFRVFLHWLSQQDYAKRAGSVHAGTRRNSGDYAFGAEEVFAFASGKQQQSDEHKPVIHFAPARGAHWLRIGPYRCRMSWQQDAQAGAGQRQKESLVLFFLTRDRDGPRRELQAVLDDVLKSTGEGKTALYQGAYGQWELTETRPIRPAESVILPDGVWKDLLADAQRFRGDRQRYASLGIPYRRGYLFHGPPGEGKTSTAVALAGALNCDLCVLNMAAWGMDDDRITRLLGGANANSIILIEEVDVGAPKRNAPKLVKKESDEVVMAGDASHSQITFGGFLNAIDGAAAKEGRIIIFTANDPSGLDPALLRAGRVDRQIEFKQATGQQASDLFERFYHGTMVPLDLAVLASNFRAHFERKPCSMATVQGILLANPDDPDGAVRVMKERRHEPETVPAGGDGSLANGHAAGSGIILGPGGSTRLLVG